MKTKNIATNKSCGPCHVLKSKIEKLNLVVGFKDYSDPDNLEWFTKHNIRSVPKLVIEDGDDVEIVEGIEDILNRLKNDE